MNFPYKNVFRVIAVSKSHFDKISIQLDDCINPEILIFFADITKHSAVIQSFSSDLACKHLSVDEAIRFLSNCVETREAEIYAEIEDHKIYGMMLGLFSSNQTYKSEGL